MNHQPQHAIVNSLVITLAICYFYSLLNTMIYTQYLCVLGTFFFLTMIFRNLESVPCTISVFEAI